MTEDGPQDPFTPLAEGAAATFELYQSYRQAGFNDSQALYLLGQMLHAAYKENLDEQTGL